MFKAEWIALCAISLLASGCATLVRGDKQKVKIEADPKDAVVTIAGKDHHCPATIVLKRKDTHRVTVSREGYVPIMFDYRARWDGASIGNAVLPGGSVGFGVDTIGGADRNFNKLRKIVLTKLTGPPATQPVLMWEFRGKVMSETEYAQAVALERADKTRFFGEN